MLHVRKEECSSKVRWGKRLKTKKNKNRGRNWRVENLLHSVSKERIERCRSSATVLRLHHPPLWTPGNRWDIWSCPKKYGFFRSLGLAGVCNHLANLCISQQPMIHSMPKVDDTTVTYMLVLASHALVYPDVGVPNRWDEMTRDQLYTLKTYHTGSFLGMFPKKDGLIHFGRNWRKNFAAKGFWKGLPSKRSGCKPRKSKWKHEELLLAMNPKGSKVWPGKSVVPWQKQRPMNVSKLSFQWKITTTSVLNHRIWGWNSHTIWFLL